MEKMGLKREKYWEQKLEFFFSTHTSYYISNIVEFE